MSSLGYIFLKLGRNGVSSSDQIRCGMYSGVIVLISWRSALRLPPVALVVYAKDSLGISLSYPVMFFDIKRHKT